MLKAGGCRKGSLTLGILVGLVPMCPQALASPGIGAPAGASRAQARGPSGSPDLPSRGTSRGTELPGSSTWPHPASKLSRSVSPGMRTATKQVTVPPFALHLPVTLLPALAEHREHLDAGAAGTLSMPRWRRHRKDLVGPTYTALLTLQTPPAGDSGLQGSATDGDVYPRRQRRQREGHGAPVVWAGGRPIGALLPAAG